MTHKLQQRLRGHGGFTLAESLIAILILLMVTAVVVTGIPAAQRAYVRLTDSANAQMLLSTTMTRLRDELGTATEVTVNADKSITYLRADGSESTLSADTTADPKGIYVHRKYVGTVTMEPNYLLVSELTGGKGLYMTYDLDAPSDAAPGLVTFRDLQVLDRDGSTLARLDKLQIRVLSGNVKAAS